MRRTIQQFTAIALLTAGFGVAILPDVQADMGHGEHSSPEPAAAPHTESHEEHTHPDAGTTPHDESHEEHAEPDADATPHGEDHGDHGSPHEDHGDHGSHGALEVPTDQPVPTVAVTVTPDPVSGWNIEVQTENWAFAPERVNQDSLVNEGHAHLYLNGEKLTRLYSDWYYLPSLPPGEHTLTVGLNANRHETLMHNGEPIEASVILLVP
ncbi:MAG: hypothetical protein AAGE59_08510 [Cyanobacteria bacterium P01_F01_bin.86]